MLELDFREPETFKTPDGQEYVINPLDVKDVKIIFKFIELNERLQKIKNKSKNKKQDVKNTSEANSIIYGKEGNEEPSLAELAEEIINKSIKNIESGDQLPKRYHTIKKLIQLSGHVAVATIDMNKEDIERAGGNPLELQRMLSDKSEPTSTPSKKKRAGKKKHS